MAPSGRLIQVFHHPLQLDLGTNMRKNGISVLLPTQNEEDLVEISIRSFIDFADEIIVVDNGSTDGTKPVVRDLASTYCQKVRFFDCPHLVDLYENRQFAFEQSRYRWVVRGDSDYVAYNDGEFSILKFREHLLTQERSEIPKVFSIPQPNLTGDFWHTGVESDNLTLPPSAPGRYVPPPYTPSHMMRVFEVFPGFRFERLGRWEGVRFQDKLRSLAIPLTSPVWMHCNVKSARSYLMRSERTNWRELGDFQTYPCLMSYVKSRIGRKYGTNDLDEAAGLHFENNILPFLQRYDPERWYPYPQLVTRRMKEAANYRIIANGGDLTRIHE